MKGFVDARKAFIGVAFAVAMMAHGLLGLFILVSGLVVHPAIVGAGLIAWSVGFYLITRWRLRPDRVLFIPVVLAGAFFVAVVIGERFDLVGP